MSGTLPLIFELLTGMSNWQRLARLFCHSLRRIVNGTSGFFLAVNDILSLMSYYFVTIMSRLLKFCEFVLE